jgi:hypothetical protein
LRRIVAAPVLSLLALSLAACASSDPGDTSVDSAPAMAPDVAVSTGAASENSQATTPDTGQSVGDWWNGGANNVYGAVQNDLSQIGVAGSNTDVVGMQSACLSLQTDVERAQSYTSAPDESVQQSLSGALAMYARASTDCIAAVRAGDGSLLTQASQELEQGTSMIYEATQKVNSLSGN